jgi:hypothetical protein
VVVVGTAKSYGGSGGSWGGGGDDLVDWLDSLPDGPPTSETPTSNDEPTASPADGDPGPPDGTAFSSPFPGLAKAFHGVARALQSGRGQSGVGGGAGRDGGGGGSGTSGGTRSSGTAGRVGGRAAAGVAALRSGNTAELRALGLDPAELDALTSDYAKAARIAEAATEGAPTSIQDEELRRAAAATAIWGLQQSDPPTPSDLVRRFVEEYLYRVITVELGARLRDGSTDGASSIPTEQTLRSTIRAMIRNLPEADTGAGHVDMGNAIESTYERVLDIWSAEP